MAKDRIDVLLDHSYEEDYFIASTITVNIKDETEKEEFKKKIAKKLEGDFVDPGSLLRKRIADQLKVDISLIDIDTNEIDFM